MAKKYNLDTARLPEQLNQMKDLANRGVCAFCPEHIKTETKSAIELETDNWLVKDNDYPYEHTKLHLLIIPKDHVRTLSKLSQVAQAEFLSIVSQLEQTHGLTSYAVGIRSGDMRYNGGSVEHLHAHLIVADPDYRGEERVRFKMSGHPEK